MGDPNDIYILDGYNKNAYPGYSIYFLLSDKIAMRGINQKMDYKSKTDGDEFISLLTKSLKISFDEFTPDMIFYNAGTDLLDGKTYYLS